MLRRMRRADEVGYVGGVRFNISNFGVLDHSFRREMVR